MSNLTPLGDLTPSELKTLSGLHAQKAAIVMEIGNAEVRKAALVASLDELNVRGQAVLTGVAVRLGIPAGADFTTGADGKVWYTPGPDEVGPD